MSGQPPPGGGFNPGAFEFRPGQTPFVPRNGQQPNGQQQGGFDPYATYSQQQGGQAGYGGYPQHGAAGAAGGGGNGGYGQQQYHPQQPAQQAYVPPGARGAYQPPTRNVQGFQPPTFYADAHEPTRTLGGGNAGKPVSLSIGGGGAPKAAPSLSIGGGAPKAAPSLSIGGGGGGGAKTVSLSIGGKKEDKKEEMPKDIEAPNPLQAIPPTTKTVETATPTPTPPPPSTKIESAPSPAPDAVAPDTDASVKVIKSSGTSTPTNFSKVSAKTDSDAVYKEQAAAGVEAMRDLYGDDVKDPNVKGHLNIIFTGHVDAGKSTMGGQLLFLTGAVDKRTMEKYEQEAKSAGRDTWYLSWALDSNKEERAKGKTVEVGRAYFESERRRYTILDAPGHKTYVPSMITGAAQADIAMLVSEQGCKIGLY